MAQQIKELPYKTLGEPRNTWAEPQNAWSLPPMQLPAPGEEKDLTIKDLWTVMSRRSGILFGTVALFFGLAVIACIFSTRRYQATGAIQVQKENTDALGLENMMGSAEGSSDALDANVTIQTQANILKSDTLALKVISDLELEKTQDFQAHFNPLGWALGLISPHGPADPKRASLENSPRRRTHALKVFSTNLKVKPIAGTRIIEISYLNPEPLISAAVVNHLAQGLADYNFQTRYNATAQAAEWLSGQLSDLRKHSEELQAKVIALQRKSGVFTLGETDAQGRQQVYSTALDKLEQSTAQLTQAESNRILKGAVYQVVKNGDPETISSLAGTSTISAASSPGVASSLSLIQNLRAEEATLSGQSQEMQAKFGPAYPKLGEINGKLTAIQSSIHAEAMRVAKRAENDYAVAKQVEDSARSIFAQQKRDADALNDKAIEYTIARQEADESRALYQNLLHKLREAGVIAGLKSSNITIIDPAREPSNPAKPNILLYLAAALGGGVFVGGFAAFLRDATDSKIQNLPEFEAYLGESPFGVLPFHKEPSRRLTSGPNASPFDTEVAMKQRGFEDFPVLSDPRSVYTEALRSLRTSLLLSRGGAPPQVILVTSSVASEGKSMVSINLAGLFAQQGKKVLLVDADLRRPVLQKRLRVKAKGLSSILTEEGIEQTALTAPAAMEQIPNLDVLPAGPIPPCPAELLGSEQMSTALRQWRSQYDFIILDAAPLLPVTDSVLLSTLADQTLLVARYKVTERHSLERSYRLLHRAKGTLETTAGQHELAKSHFGRRIGIVLNGVERRTSYSKYYGGANADYHGINEECFRENV
jgi:polysaccharide biosynthesis transport protein